MVLMRSNQRTMRKIDKASFIGYYMRMHTHDKKSTLDPFVFFVLTALFLIEPIQAFAYIDPGTGSFFIQMIIASAVGLSVTIRMFWTSIKGFFVRKSSPAESAQLRDTYDDGEKNS